MSKESALRMATGNPTAVANPSLVTPEISTPKPDLKVATDPGTVEPAAGATADPAQPADPKLSIIIRKETELFKKAEAFKKEQADFQATRTEYTNVIDRVKQFEELAKTNKREAIKMLGWSKEDIAAITAEDPSSIDPAEQVRKIAQEESQKIRDELAAEKKKAAEAKDSELVTNFRNDIKAKIKEDAQKYKFAAHEGHEAELQAYHIIVENLKATQTEELPNGELMSIEEALEITNDLYKDKYETAKKAFEEQQAAAEVPAQNSMSRGRLSGLPPVSNVPTPKPKTLSSAVTATSTSAPTQVRESREEKKERLAALIRTHGLRK